MPFVPTIKAPEIKLFKLEINVTSSWLESRLKMKKSLFIFENKLIPSRSSVDGPWGGKHVPSRSRKSSEFLLLYFQTCRESVLWMRAGVVVVYLDTHLIIKLLNWLVGEATKQNPLSIVVNFSHTQNLFHLFLSLFFPFSGYFPQFTATLFSRRDKVLMKIKLQQTCGNN